MRHLEKSPLKSKKFVAFLVADVTWKLLMGLVLFLVPSGLLQTIILCIMGTIAGFVEAGFIIGQASLDRYVRVAQINASLAGKQPDPEIPINIVDEDDDD